MAPRPYNEVPFLLRTDIRLSDSSRTTHCEESIIKILYVLWTCQKHLAVYVDGETVLPMTPMFKGMLMVVGRCKAFGLNPSPVRTSFSACEISTVQAMVRGLEDEGMFESKAVFLHSRW